MILVKPSVLRTEIVSQILSVFEKNIPIYKEMMAVADTINQKAGAIEAERLGRIMHAAIRCANPEELQMIRRIFALMANSPVNYYDLREKVSVQSTAFRPITRIEINLNGFRVFCSMLDMECIGKEHRTFVQSIIDRRSLFSSKLVELVEIGEEQGGFDKTQAESFVQECVTLFTRPDEALISFDEYKQLKSINKVVAQVLVCNALAFNHLTPSVASVPEAHAEMVKRGIKAIKVYQGPVGLDVILRQTSCLAPAVMLQFPNGDGTFTEAEYQETFVEFEERQQALTPVGRLLFEQMYSSGKQCLLMGEDDEGYAEHYYTTMNSALLAFPRDLIGLWKKGYAYFTFKATKSGLSHPVRELADMSFDELIEKGFIELIPQIYEDFYGPAATNIFNSNIGLKNVSNVVATGEDAKAVYEEMLGCKVVNMYDYYDGIQQSSKEAVCDELGVSVNR